MSDLVPVTASIPELMADEAVASPTAPPGLDPMTTEVLKGIFQRFKSLRSSSGKAEAWLSLLNDLMEYGHVLVPNILPLKDFLAACRETEEYIKGSSKAGESAQDLFTRYVQGDASQIGLDIPPIPVVGTMSSRDAEVSEKYEQGMGVDAQSDLAAAPEDADAGSQNRTQEQS